MNGFRRILRLMWQVLFPYEMVSRSKHPARPPAPMPPLEMPTLDKIKHSA